MGLRQVPDRLTDAIEFYRLLEHAERKMGGRRQLGSLIGRLTLPQRGVYFFFEPQEIRTSTGSGGRVVRVGTHALTANSRSTLGGRLKQHRGLAKGIGGNHRGSIFRLLVGKALISEDGIVNLSTWGVKSSAGQPIRSMEREMEARVSAYLASMEIVWLAVSDDPGRNSQRGVIERGAIALLSNLGKEALDPPSTSWLGRSSHSEKVRLSGLWNQNHVDETYDSAFFDCLRHVLEQNKNQ